MSMLDILFRSIVSISLPIVHLTRSVIRENYIISYFDTEKITKKDEIEKILNI